MDIRIINFEILTRHYKTYRDGVDDIENKKSELLKKLEPFKTMANLLIASSLNQVESSKQDREEFQRLQEEAIELEKTFSVEIKKMSSDLNVLVYNELLAIIEDWSIKNNIDMVVNSLEVVFCKKNYDSTDDILDILKSINMFVEFNES